MKNRHGKWVNLPLPFTTKPSPAVSSRHREEIREVEYLVDVASLCEAVALLQRAMAAIGQEKAQAEARASASELHVEEFVVKAAAAEAAVSVRRFIPRQHRCR